MIKSFYDFMAVSGIKVRWSYNKHVRGIIEDTEKL